MRSLTLSKQAAALLALLFVSCLMIPFETQITFTQANERTELTVTLNPVTPVTTDLTPDDYRFELIYVLSSYFLNGNDAATNLTFPQAMLGWYFGNNSIYNPTLSDNLGHQLEPVVEDGKVSNPEATFTIPANYEYRISLSFSTDQGVVFDEEKMIYGLVVGSTSASQTSLRLPENFTVLECTPNATQEEGGGFITLKWSQGTTQAVFATFVPFHLQGTTRSFTFAIDIPSVTPIGVVRGTIEETFTTPASFSIWPINPMFAIKVSFPEYGQVLNVSGVWDKTGPCLPLEEAPAKLDNNSLGRYYVDKANRVVIVYPRYDYKGDFYQYTVGATFTTPPEYKPFEMKAVKEDMLPYRYESYFVIDKVLSPANWDMNITGNVETEFLLPVGVEILKEESGNPHVDVQDGRPIALFVYYPTGTLSPISWKVVYEMTTQRDLFRLELWSLIVLAILTILLLVLPSRIIGNLASVVVSSGLLVTLLFFNVQNYMSIGWSNPKFSYLLIGEVALFSISMIILSWKSLKKLSRRKANQCPECGGRTRYLGSRLSRRHFTKEYECLKCDNVIRSMMVWRTDEKNHVCKSCGEGGHKIYQVQTGQFRNEKGKSVDVEVKCPKCGMLTWIRMQIRKEVTK